MKKLLLVLLAVAVSTTLGGAALTVLAGFPPSYIGVVGGGSQPVGPTFTVDIDVFTADEDFCGYNHELSYDPTKVQVDSVTFQESFATGYLCLSSIDNVAGKVVGSCARLGCPPLGAFSGTDQVEMHCIDAGDTPLVLDPNETRMRDNDNQPITISLYDGSVTCQEEAAAAPFVGGMVEMQLDGSDSPASLAGDSGSSSPPYAALAGAAAAGALALTAGAWYARRRWLA